MDTRRELWIWLVYVLGPETPKSICFLLKRRDKKNTFKERPVSPIATCKRIDCIGNTLSNKNTLKSDQSLEDLLWVVMILTTLHNSMIMECSPQPLNPPLNLHVCITHFDLNSSELSWIDVMSRDHTCHENRRHWPGLGVSAALEGALAVLLGATDLAGLAAVPPLLAGVFAVLLAAFGGIFLGKYQNCPTSLL